MLGTDARRVAEELNAAAPSGVRAEVRAEAMHSQGAPLPGGSTPRITSYRVAVADTEREALLEIDEARQLLDGLGPDWDADRVFAVITDARIPVGRPEHTG